jgi:hypothetical protein
MKALSYPALAALGAVLAWPAAAATLDGSQPMICAATEVYECEASVKCEQETAEKIDVPTFLAVSVPNKTVTGTRPSGQGVNAKIELERHLEQELILQGVTNALGWTMVIDTSGGKMLLTVADSESSYIVFGACAAGTLSSEPVAPPKQ